MFIHVATLSTFNWARFANVAQIAISRFVYGEATTKYHVSNRKQE